MSEGKKHILYLSSWYPNKYHPFLGNFVKRQVELLSSTYKVTVINTVPDVRVGRLEIDDTSEGNLREITVFHPPGKGLIRKRNIQKSALDAALFELRDVDLLMTQIILPKGWQFIHVQKQFGCPWIHLEQGSYFRKSVRSKWKVHQKLIVRKAAKKITRLLAASDFVKADMITVFNKREIGLLPNHVNTEIFVPAETKQNNPKKRFLHISTLDSATKNPKGIFDACRILKDRGVESFELLVVSDEPSENWQSYCDEQGISSIVRFEGPKQWEELPEYYQQADAFVLNSIYETFSVVLAEAWACGIPTITTSVGIGHQIPDFLGINTEINNPISLASSMEKVIHGDVLFDANKIRNYGLQYSQDSVLNALKAVIDEELG